MCPTVSLWTQLRSRKFILQDFLIQQVSRLMEKTLCPTAFLLDSLIQLFIACGKHFPGFEDLPSVPVREENVVSNCILWTTIIQVENILQGFINLIEIPEEF